MKFKENYLTPTLSKGEGEETVFFSKGERDKQERLSKGEGGIGFKAQPDDNFERRFWDENKFVAGIDEAGRGPLAGPVVAAAVILPVNFKEFKNINDSKKLKEKDRELLFDFIKENVLAFGIGFVDNETIDKINILQATLLAMKQAIDNLNLKPQHLLIDGNYFKDDNIPYTTIVKGDSKSVSIAAASILAKVTRDRWMIESAHVKFPEYDFAKHKGYGTKKHYDAIEQYGQCEFHRKSFLKEKKVEVLNLF